MKYLLILLLLSSCENLNQDITRDNVSNLRSYLKEPKILVYEDCEYIYFYNSYGSSITHKGNCNNPKHVYNK